MAEDSYYGRSSNWPEKVIVFDAKQYTQVIGGLDFDKMAAYFFRGSVSSSLPELLPEELRQLISKFPDPEDALYRIPGREYDDLGKMVLQRTINAINEYPGGICVVEQPERWTELRIGLDLLLGFTELIWRIGKNEKGVVVQFVQEPYFPLWLRGEAIDKAFASEPFLKE